MTRKSRYQGYFFHEGEGSLEWQKNNSRAECWIKKKLTRKLRDQGDFFHEGEGSLEAENNCPRDVSGEWEGCQSRILRGNRVTYEIFSMTEMRRSENLVHRGVDILSRDSCTQFMGKLPSQTMTACPAT